MATYEVRVVNYAGANPNGGGSPLVLVNANVTNIKRVKNGIRTATVTMGVFDPQTSELHQDLILSGIGGSGPDRLKPAREIQLWRDGLLKFWGYPNVPEFDTRAVTFECESKEGYLGGRFFGPNVIEYLLEGDFEGSTDGVAPVSWGQVGCAVVARVDGLSTELPAAKGSVAVTGGPIGPNYTRQDAYLHQTFRLVVGDLLADHFTQVTTVPAGVTTHTVNGRPFQEGDRQGLLVHLSAKFRTRLFGGLWTGPAIGEFGLMLIRRTTAGVLIQKDWAPITAAIQIGKWITLETQLVVPASTTEDVEVRLYQPGAVSDWDAAQATSPESVGNVAGTPMAVADLMRLVVMEAAQLHPTKTDLGIAFAGSGGTKLEREYPYDGDGNILSALQELARATDADFEVTHNVGGTASTFTCYPTGQGSFKPELGITVRASDINDAEANPADFSGSYDGKQCANSVRVLGQGSGLARDRAHVGLLDPDPVFESVVTADADTPVKLLHAIAEKEWTRTRRPPAILELTVYSEDHILGLGMGDTIPVIIDWGYAQVDGVYAVVADVLTPGPESLKLILNLAS